MARNILKISTAGDITFPESQQFNSQQRLWTWQIVCQSPRLTQDKRGQW
ncbi:hypothetical protein [Nostoc sp.]